MSSRTNSCIYFLYFKPFKPIKTHKTTGCARLFIMPYASVVRHLRPALNIYGRFDAIWCIHYCREIKTKKQNKNTPTDMLMRATEKHKHRTRASPVSCPAEKPNQPGAIEGDERCCGALWEFPMFLPRQINGPLQPVPECVIGQGFLGRCCV